MEEHTRGGNRNTSQESGRNPEDIIGEALENLLSLAKMLQEKTSPQKSSPTKPNQTVSAESYRSIPQQQIQGKTSQTVSRDVSPAARPVGRISKTQTPSPKKSSTQRNQTKGTLYPCLTCWKHGIQPSSLCVHNQTEGIDHQSRTEDQERMKTYYSTNQQIISNPTAYKRNRLNETVNKYSHQRVHSHPYNSAPSVPKATNVTASASRNRDKNVTRKFNVSQTNDYSQFGRNRSLAGQNPCAISAANDKLNATVNQSEMNGGRNVSNLNNSHLNLSSVNQSQAGMVDSRLDIKSKSESLRVHPGSSGHNLCNISHGTSSFDTTPSHNLQTINSQKLPSEKQMHKLDRQKQQQTHSQAHSKTKQNKQCSKLLQNEKYTKTTTQFEANTSISQHTKHSLNRENKHEKSHKLNTNVSGFTSSAKMNQETSAPGKLKSSGSAKNVEGRKRSESAPKSSEDFKSSARYPPGIEKTLQVIANNIKNNLEQNKETKTQSLPKKRSSSKSKKDSKPHERKSVTNLTGDEISDSASTILQNKLNSHTQERKQSQNTAKDPINTCLSKDTSKGGVEEQKIDRSVQRKKSEVAFEPLKRFSFGDSNTPKQKHPTKTNIRISLEDLVSCTEDQSKQAGEKDHHQSVSLGNEEVTNQNHSAENQGLDEDLPMLVRSRRHSAKQCTSHHDANTSTTENPLTNRNISPKSKDSDNNGHKEVHKSVNEIPKLQDISTTEYKDAKETTAKSEPIQQTVTVKNDNSVESEVKISGGKAINFENSTEVNQANAHCKFLNFLTRPVIIKNRTNKSIPDDKNASKSNKQFSSPVNYQNDAVTTETENMDIEQSIRPQSNKTSEVKSMEKDDSNIKSKLKTENDRFSTKDSEKQDTAQPLMLTNIKEEPVWEIDNSILTGSSNIQMNENSSDKVNNKEDGNRNIWEDLQLHDEATSSGLFKTTALNISHTQTSHSTKESLQGKESQKTHSNGMGKTWQQLMKPSEALNIEIPKNPELMPMRIKTEPVSPPVPIDNHDSSLMTEKPKQLSYNRQQNQNIKVKEEQIDDADNNKVDKTTKKQQTRNSNPLPNQQNKDQQNKKRNVQDIHVKKEPVEDAFPTPEVTEQNAISKKPAEILTEIEKSSSLHVKQEKKNTTETTTTPTVDSSEFLHQKDPSSKVSTCLETRAASVTECDEERENVNSLRTIENLNEQSKVKDKNNCFDASYDPKRPKTKISPIKFISDSHEKETCEQTEVNFVNQKGYISTGKTKVIKKGNRTSTYQNTENSLPISIPSEQALHTTRKKTASKRIVTVGDTFLQQKNSSTSSDKNTLAMSKQDKNKPDTSREAEISTSKDTLGKNPVHSDKEVKKFVSSVVAVVSVKEKIIERQKKVVRQTREQSVARQIVRKRITATPARPLKTQSKLTQSRKSMKESIKPSTKTDEGKNYQSQNSSTKQKEKPVSQNARSETTGTSKEKDTTLRKTSTKLMEEKENQRTTQKTNSTRRRWSPRNNDMESRNVDCTCLRCRQQRYREKSPENRFISQYKPNYRYESVIIDKYRSRDTRSDRSYYYDSEYSAPSFYERYPRYSSPPMSPGSWNSSYDSYRRGRSPIYRSPSPDYRWRSRRGRSISPSFRGELPLRRSRSPPYRTRSPFQRHRSPFHRSRSPMHRSRSPLPRSRSPIHRSRSPMTRSRSPEYRKYRSPKNDTLSKRITSPPHSNSSTGSLLENFAKGTAEEFNDNSQLFSTSVKKFGHESFMPKELPKPKPQKQVMKHNKLEKPLRNNASVTEKMEEFAEKPTMTEVSSAFKKCHSSSADLIKNNQIQLKTTQVKKAEHVRQSNLIQIDTTSFQVSIETVASLKPNKPIQMPPISSVKKAAELKKSNDNMKKMLVGKKQRTPGKTMTHEVSEKNIEGTSDTKSKNLKKIIKDGKKKPIEVEEPRMNEVAEQKGGNAGEQNVIDEKQQSKDQTKTKGSKIENGHTDKVKEAVTQNNEKTLKQMELETKPSAKKAVKNLVPCEQNEKPIERGKSSEKEEKQMATDDIMNITKEKSIEKEEKPMATDNIMNITKKSTEKEEKQMATDNIMNITKEKSSKKEDKQIATDNIMNTTKEKLSEKEEKQMTTNNTMVKCKTKETDEADESKLSASEDVQTVVESIENAKLKKTRQELHPTELPSNQQPEKETRKAPSKDDTTEVKPKEKPSRPISPSTSEYVDINLKNMTHIYICDGRQVCNAFNMSSFTGIDCPGTCNQLHLSLPIYNPSAKINMSISQTEELADVLKDSKGNVCFFNLSQKMICNNFNSAEGCMNRNCFMIHTSFYKIFNAFFIRKLKGRKFPKYVKQQCSLAKPDKTKLPVNSDHKCKVRLHPEEKVTEPHDHTKDTPIQVKDWKKEKGCEINVKKISDNENEASNNKSSVKKFQNTESITDQKSVVQNQISGTSSKQQTPDDRNDNNQKDTSNKVQGTFSDSVVNKSEQTIKIDTSERKETNQPKNADDLVTVINVKSPWRVCRYFNTSRGCRRWNCSFHHVQNQPSRSVKSNVKSHLKNSTSSDNLFTRKGRSPQKDLPISTEKQNHPPAKKMKKTKSLEISKESEKQTKGQTCGKIIGQIVKQETIASKNTENVVMKTNANAESNKAREIENQKTGNHSTEIDKKPSDTSKLPESNTIKGLNSGSSEIATSLKDISGNNNQEKTLSASQNAASSNYPSNRKRKPEMCFQHRAAKMPRQSRKSNWQALLTRQQRFLTRNPSSTYHHNYYNSEPPDWRLEQTENYRLPDRRLEHLQNYRETVEHSENYREPDWRFENSQNYRESVEHSQIYRGQRLFPDFNTQWGCPLPYWECPYIHDYAEDIHFS